MTDQRDFFREVELSYWAEAEGLKDEEVALVERYLDPSVPTLDAGTGGGRIPRALRARGFGALSGFDFAPELVAAASASDPNGAIRFDVADATDLPYEDGSFGQALYLQQIVCTIDDEAGRRAALAEAARVLRPGGLALFSFVCLESRLASPAQRAYMTYLRAVRRLRRTERPIQSMPRLRLSGRLDPGALRDSAPTTGGTEPTRRRRRWARPGSRSRRSASATRPSPARSAAAPPTHSRRAPAAPCTRSRKSPTSRSRRRICRSVAARAGGSW